MAFYEAEPRYILPRLDHGGRYDGKSDKALSRMPDHQDRHHSLDEYDEVLGTVARSLAERALHSRNPHNERWLEQGRNL